MPCNKLQTLNKLTPAFPPDLFPRTLNKLTPVPPRSTRATSTRASIQLRPLRWEEENSSRRCAKLRDVSVISNIVWDTQKILFSFRIFLIQNLGPLPIDICLTMSPYIIIFFWQWVDDRCLTYAVGKYGSECQPLRRLLPGAFEHQLYETKLIILHCLLSP